MEHWPHCWTAGQGAGTVLSKARHLCLSGCVGCQAWTHASQRAHFLTNVCALLMWLGLDWHQTLASRSQSRPVDFWSTPAMPVVSYLPHNEFAPAFCLFCSISGSLLGADTHHLHWLHNSPSRSPGALSEPWRFSPVRTYRLRAEVLICPGTAFCLANSFAFPRSEITEPKRKIFFYYT